MTCTIARSSSLKHLCHSLTNFPWKPNISFMGNSTGSKIPFWHQMPSKKGTWPTYRQPSKSTSQPILRLLKKSCSGASCSVEEVVAYKALFQEFHDIFSWSYTEMPGLYPSIVEHHVNTWPNVAPMWKKQWPIHPSKAVAVKAEIEKLRTTGFIYPIAYTTWVSNPIPMNKK